LATATCILERYLTAPRHIEVQVIGDKNGNVVSFPERDCSVQRRHQKLIEESPSSSISESVRKKMGKAARLAAKAVKYHTVGTVEFLYDKKADDFFFIEMNTRIQVEHPVTEMVTGVDLIKEQIRTAAGEKLPFSSDDVQIRHHAMECRINAEDPERNFMPSPGKITQLILPGGPGVRVDTHIYQGYTIPAYYDSLMAKLIVATRYGAGGGREHTIRRMARALNEFTVDGVKTTIPFPSGRHGPRRVHERRRDHRLHRKTFGASTGPLTPCRPDENGFQEVDQSPTERIFRQSASPGGRRPGD
jgi:acetyl-CoA carboxylase biotin carboxylase subunit